MLNGPAVCCNIKISTYKKLDQPKLFERLSPYNSKENWCTPKNRNNVEVFQKE